MGIFFQATSGVLLALSYNTVPATLPFILLALLAASSFYNWLWRIVVFVLSYLLLGLPSEYKFSVLLFAAIFTTPTFALFGFRKPQPVEGAVFITGCDSGMGFWTASLLAEKGCAVVRSFRYLEAASPSCHRLHSDGGLLP